MQEKNKKKAIQEAIDDLSLALMYLTRFGDREGSHYDEIFWKGYDFDSVERLDNEGFIVNPKRKKGGDYKYAYLTEKGRERLVLTCLANKVKMYTKLGFRDLGDSASEWGGEKWHEMEIVLNW